MRKKKLFAITALIGGGTSAALLGALPAVGANSPPSSPVVIQGTGSLVAKGAAADITVLYTCQPNPFPYYPYDSVYLTVTERSGKVIASGNGASQTLNCDGNINSATIPVAAQNHPFTAGTAFVQASLQSCGYYGCNNSTATNTVRLR